MKTASQGGCLVLGTQTHTRHTHTQKKSINAHVRRSVQLCYEKINNDEDVQVQQSRNKHVQNKCTYVYTHIYSMHAYSNVMTQCPKIISQCVR